MWWCAIAPVRPGKRASRRAGNGGRGVLGVPHQGKDLGDYGGGYRRRIKAGVVETFWYEQE